MKKYLILHLFAAVSCTVLLTSCPKEKDTDVSQNRIYTEYEIFYNKATDKTTANAVFRMGGKTGTLLEVTSKDGVKFNDDPIGYNSFWGWHTKEYTGFINGGKFEYTNSDGKKFTNTLAAFKSAAIPSSIDTLRKNGTAYTVTWVGDPLGAEEEVYLTIYNNNNQSWIYSQLTQGQNSVVIDAATLGNFVTAPATMVIDRYYKPALVDKNEVGGEIRGKYTFSKSIYIK